MENLPIELNNFRDESQRLIQTMNFVDEDGNYTRDGYFHLDEALQLVENSFHYENQKSYLIKYLTSYGWKSARTFRYAEGATDFANHVFNENTEQANYNTQALEGNQIHVYAIQVRQMSI